MLRDSTIRKSLDDYIKSRKETQAVQLGLDQNLVEAQALIREAYSSIH